MTTQALIFDESAELARMGQARIMTRKTVKDGLIIRETASFAQAPDGHWVVAYRSVDRCNTPPASVWPLYSFISPHQHKSMALLEFGTITAGPGWKPVEIAPAQTGGDR